MLPAPRSTLPARALPPDDERLAVLVGEGDGAALDALYARFAGELFRYARTIVRDEDDAADVLQETFLRAIRALREGRRDAPVRPWLYRIARNESITLLRRRPACAPAPDEDLPAARTTAEEAEQAEEVRTLLADLDRLTERQRSALVLREFEGLSHREIGHAMLLDANAVKQAIFEARSALHEFAEGRRIACADVRAVIAQGDGRRLRAKTLRAHLGACRGCRARALSG